MPITPVQLFAFEIYRFLLTTSPVHTPAQIPLPNLSSIITPEGASINLRRVTCYTDGRLGSTGRRSSGLGASACSCRLSWCRTSSWS